MWDQFSHLIVLVSVLHVVGTLGMLMALVKKVLAFGWKHFLSIKNETPPYFVKPLDLASGTSVRNTVNLIFFNEKLQGKPLSIKVRHSGFKP